MYATFRLTLFLNDMHRSLNFAQIQYYEILTMFIQHIKTIFQI